VFQLENGLSKGDWKRKSIRCSNCQGTNHNCRSCRFAPALNGRRQRARDQELSDSDSNGTSSSRQDDNGFTLSDLDSDDLQDLQWQAEMARYDEIRKRADEIRDLQQIEPDSESQSELSVLASSQFDGMDGIEFSQSISTKLGNANVGRTSAVLANQDVQDNQGNSIDDQGHGIDGGVGAQGIGTSPRRTRSGKVVKYDSILQK
jgi:hypothetical protein